MPRLELKLAMLTGMILSVWSLTAQAADQVVYRPTQPVPISRMQTVSQPIPHHIDGPPSQMGGVHTASDGYPYLNAPLYPSPSPFVPARVGSTVITNQAMDPHEMLYPHRYRAMYGPYSYRVHGGWIWTPFGIHSQEHWKLQGTMVDVKYHSEISPFALFHPKW
ncbi:hypothetical protein Pla110_26880 [Polystyrenella longa]|uniref:Uncharacterized protein n=1 Tax=Polystyrenella longa TaxID=2528007 RepID=A0A518CP04_9PLAN|nr:hypothetical protein [Polystyrenella longa]QDU80952.1 hypothetical protein Pla110_26880 [Polystyrenella longa]